MEANHVAVAHCNVAKVEANNVVATHCNVAKVEENNVAAGTDNVARCSGDAVCRLRQMRPQFLIFLLTLSKLSFPLKVMIA